jgi:PAS domain S-box-containing protein
MHARAPSAGAAWERLFWLAFHRSSDASVLLDDQRRFVEVNDSAVALLGRSRGEIMGTSIVDSIRPSERPEAARQWRALLRTGESAGTRVFVRGDGSEVEVEFAARLAFVGERRLALYVALARSDNGRSLAPAQRPERRLSNREREVVTLIAVGRRTSEIAAELHISADTVQSHVRNAMSKLGVHTRAQLVAVALSTDTAIQLPWVGE